MKLRIKKSIMSILMLMVTGSLAVASCHQGQHERTERATEMIAPEEAFQIEEVMNPENDMVLQDENGKKVLLSSLKGKVVFINFWATWCPPCIQEMPSIHQLKKKFKEEDPIVFMTVDVDNNIEKSSSFMRNKKYDLPVYVPTDNIPARYLGNSIPTTVILDKSGELVARIEGARDYTQPEILEALQELMVSQ